MKTFQDYSLSFSLLNKRFLSKEISAGMVGLVKEGSRVKRDATGNLVVFEQLDDAKKAANIKEGTDTIEAASSSLETITTETRESVSAIQNQLKKESLTAALQEYARDAAELAVLPSDDTSAARKLTKGLAKQLVQALADKTTLLTDEISEIDNSIQSMEAMKALVTELYNKLVPQLAEIEDSISDNNATKASAASSATNIDAFAIALIDEFNETLDGILIQNGSLFDAIVLQVQNTLPTDLRVDLSKIENPEEIKSKILESIVKYINRLSQKKASLNQQKSENISLSSKVSTETKDLTGSANDQTQKKEELGAKMKTSLEEFKNLQALIQRLFDQFESTLDQGDESSLFVGYLAAKGKIDGLLSGEEVFELPKNWAKNLCEEIESSTKGLCIGINAYLTDLVATEVGVTKEDLATLIQKVNDVENTSLVVATFAQNPDQAVETYLTSCGLSELIEEIKTTIENGVKGLILQLEQVAKAKSKKVRRTAILLEESKIRLLEQKTDEFTRLNETVRGLAERKFSEYLMGENIESKTVQHLREDEETTLQGQLDTVRTQFAEDLLLNQALAPFVSQADLAALSTHIQTEGNEATIAIHWSDEKDTHSRTFEISRSAENQLVINGQALLDEEITRGAKGLLGSLNNILQQMTDGKYEKTAQVKIDIPEDGKTNSEKPEAKDAPKKRNWGASGRIPRLKAGTDEADASSTADSQ